MAITIETKVPEESTAVVTAAFYDADDAPVVPSEIKWTLSMENGTIINSRSEVAIAVPAQTVTIVIHGADTAIQSAADNARRVLTVKAKYSSSFGSGLELNGEIRFSIEKLVNVT